MDVQIKIKNLAQIKSAFNRAPALMTRYLNIAIRKIVFQIGRRSRMNTPVYTGRLRASTYEKFSNLEGEVGTKVEYDKFVHEGTRFMKGRPYLRFAVEGEQHNTDRFFNEAVSEVLDIIGKQT